MVVWRRAAHYRARMRCAVGGTLVEITEKGKGCWSIAAQAKFSMQAGVVAVKQVFQYQIGGFMSIVSKLGNAIRDPRTSLANWCQRYLDRHRGYSYEFYDNGESELLARIAKTRPRTVFDVGANVGEWANIAANVFPEAQIHCFELSERTFSTLQTNAKGSRFHLNNIGLSDQAGTFTYKDYGDNSGVNTLLLDATFHDANIQPRLIKAPLTTGDIYCDEHNIRQIDFLKIDVEGAEHLVLGGFANTLGKQAIRAVQFEYGYVNGDSKFLMRDFYRLFEQHGYIVGRVKKGAINFREWTYKDNDFTSGPNYVAIRKGDNELLAALALEAGA